MPDVLVATDADWIARQCEAALDGEHSLYVVRRGSDVVAAVAQIDPSIVLLDLQIGNMGGMATCLALRQEEDMGRLEPRPVLMLLDRIADEFMARRSSADGWLVKPINPMSLAKAVRSALADRTSETDTTSETESPGHLGSASAHG